MVTGARNWFWATGMALGYTLYACGQLWLFISKQKEADFYKLINTYPADWINAHLTLMMGVALFIPAWLGFCHFFKPTRYYGLIVASTVFTVLTVFVLFGQFTIDLTLPALFTLPSEAAYQALDAIQNDTFLKPLFYDNSGLFSLLKYADFMLLSQVLLGIPIVLSKHIPRWAALLYWVAVVLTQFGILIDPYYGRLVKRGAYALFSLSFLPIGRAIIKKTNPALHR